MENLGLVWRLDGGRPRHPDSVAATR